MPQTPRDPYEDLPYADEPWDGAGWEPSEPPEPMDWEPQGAGFEPPLDWGPGPVTPVTTKVGRSASRATASAATSSAASAPAVRRATPSRYPSAVSYTHLTLPTICSV